jgi:hypothetical protein
MSRSQLWRTALSAAVIATLWMFPLLNALSSGPTWLHWTALDSLETLAAWAAGALVVGLSLAAPAAAGRPRMYDIVCSAWLLTATLLVVGAVVKIDGITAHLDPYRQHSTPVVAFLAVTLLLGAGLLVAYPGRSEASRLQRGVVMLWPLLLLFGFHLATAPYRSASQSAALAAVIPTATADLPPRRVSHEPDPARTRTVILLFDELSPDYLYGDRAVDLTALPALRQLHDQGQVHADAKLSGGETRLAIPALLSPTPDAPLGLVPSLVADGDSVRIWGWYHTYCLGLTRGAQACHSNSIYNPRTLHEGFSLIDPWWTDFNLLPFESPFGLLKIPTATALHRATLAQTSRWLAAQLQDPTADVIYAHVNVPHLPLLDPASHAPFKMTESGYLSQFGAVDAVVAQALNSTVRPTQLIVLSDHNARPLFPRSQHEHIVFVRWRSWVPTGSSISGPQDAAGLLARLSRHPELP